MSKISTWSTTAASNNATSPDGFPENMAPSGVNDSAREVMASVREQHEDAQWIDLGDTPTFTSATTFTIPGDVTGTYDVNRRLKFTDSSTLYGTITISAYTSLTTITVVLDSGVLSASLSAVATGIISGTNKSIVLEDEEVTLAKMADMATASFIGRDTAGTGAPEILSAADARAVLGIGDQAVVLNTTVLDIGDWNMDSNSQVLVAHGLDHTKIRTVNTTIRNDSGSGGLGLNSIAEDALPPLSLYSCTWNSTNIILNRQISGEFDSTDYNATSYNRGWIVIWYVD